MYALKVVLDEFFLILSNFANICVNSQLNLKQIHVGFNQGSLGTGGVSGCPISSWKKNEFVNLMLQSPFKCI